MSYRLDNYDTQPKMQDGRFAETFGRHLLRRRITTPAPIIIVSIYSYYCSSYVLLTTASRQESVRGGQRVPGMVPIGGQSVQRKWVTAAFLGIWFFVASGLESSGLGPRAWFRAQGMSARSLVRLYRCKVRNPRERSALTKSLEFGALPLVTGRFGFCCELTRLIWDAWDAKPLDFCEQPGGITWTWVWPSTWASFLPSPAFWSLEPQLGEILFKEGGMC